MSILTGTKMIPSVNTLPPWTSFAWTRERGSSFQFWRKGPQADLLALLPGLQVQYDSVKIDQISGGYYQLVAAQVDDQVNKKQEITGSNKNLSKLVSLKLFDDFVALGCPADDPAGPQFTASGLISKIAAAVNKHKNDPVAYTYAKMQGDVQTFATQIGGAGSVSLAWRFMNDLDQNGDNALSSQYEFTTTLSMSERAFQAGGFTDFIDIFQFTDEVFTEGQMRAEEQIPDDANLPQQIVDETQSAFWLKLPTHSIIEQNRRTVTLSYLHADVWSNLYYYAH